VARASRGRRRRPRERVRGMSEGAKLPSESAGEGVANQCPEVTDSSCRSQTYQLRMRANRLGRAWQSGARMSRAVSVTSRGVSVTQSLPHTYGIGWGGRGQPVPGSVRSWSSRHYHTRIESAGRRVDIPGRTGGDEQVDGDRLQGDQRARRSPRSSRSPTATDTTVQQPDTGSSRPPQPTHSSPLATRSARGHTAQSFD